MPVVSTLATILSAVLAFAFLGAGGSKVANKGPHEAEFERYGLPGLPPQTARVVVGAVEVLAALLLALAAILGSSGLAVVGAIIVVAAMLGALATHARLGDPPPAFIPATVLLVLAAVLLAVA